MSPVDFAFGPLEPPSAPATAQDADHLLAAAHLEAERLRETARREGLRQGRQEAAEAVAPAIAALTAITAAAREHGEQAADRLEADAVALAFALTEQILGRAVAADPGLVVDAVRGALRSLVEREQITVIVHPDDLDAVREAGDELRAALGGIERWDVQAERRVARGGAVVRYRDGEIDATHTAKLARAADIVRDQLATPSTA